MLLPKPKPKIFMSNSNIRIPEFIKKTTGYDIKRYLGQGSYGKVYLTTKPNIVVKITSHHKEAKTFAKIMKLRQKGETLRGIVDVFNVIHFKNFNRDFFIIVKEYLKNINIKYQNAPFYALNSYNFNFFKHRLDLFKDIFLMYNTIRRLDILNISIWDIRIGNIGMRGKDPVLFDLASESLSKIKITIPSFGSINKYICGITTWI